jgi:hypothetical protein
MRWNKRELEGNRCEDLLKTSKGQNWYVRPTGHSDRTDMIAWMVRIKIIIHALPSHEQAAILINK